MFYRFRLCIKHRFYSLTESKFGLDFRNYQIEIYPNCVQRRNIDNKFFFFLLYIYFFFKLETAWLYIFFSYFFFISSIFLFYTYVWYYLFNTFDVVPVSSHIRAKFFRRFWRSSSRTFRMLCSRHLKSSTTSSGMMLRYSSSERWSSWKVNEKNGFIIRKDRMNILWLWEKDTFRDDRLRNSFVYYNLSKKLNYNF